MKNSKTIDCVAAKHAAAQSVYKELKGKTLKERLVFWQAHERSMRAASRGSNRRARTTSKAA